MVDEPVFSFLKENSDALNNVVVFDGIVKSDWVETKVFAGHKPGNVLKYATMPFVVVMDVDIVATHRNFPEAIFDMLHKEYDLILPIDWAHRHEAFGKGVPGLCTCLIGFLNDPSSVRRVLEAWAREVALGDSVDEERIKYLGTSKNEGTHRRDQELLSLVLYRDDYPDVKLFPLGMEWVCANANKETARWFEGSSSLDDPPFYPITTNPCRSIHSHLHVSEKIHYVREGPIKKFLESFFEIPMTGGEFDKSLRYKCGGAPINGDAAAEAAAAAAAPATATL